MPQQPGGIAAFDVDRLQIFAQGIAELAKAQIPRLLAEIAEAEARLEEGSSASPDGVDGTAAAALQPSIEKICDLSRALLQHPSFEVKEVAVAFFRNLLGHLVVLLEEERRLVAWRDHLRLEGAGAAGVGGRAETTGGAGGGNDVADREGAKAALEEVERRYESNLQALALREPLLSRLFSPFVEAAVQELQPPVAALLREELEFEKWQSFRSELAATVTEAAILLDIDAPCNACGSHLLDLLKDPQASNTFSFL